MEMINLSIEIFLKVFKALSNKTRLKIVLLLSDKDLCVCEITEILQTSQPRVSQHLRVLKDASLVEEQVCGPLRIYSLQKKLLEETLYDFLSTTKEPLSKHDELSHYAEVIESIGNTLRK
jgi:ArsR family transcriptional regulator